MIIIIDNYDSFTYNLYQYIGELNEDIEVYRNDKISIDEIRKKAPTHIVLSPGPGFPNNAGISMDIVRKFGKTTPILGVCLGHQAIGEAYGGTIVHAKKLMHGKSSVVDLTNECELFIGLQKKISVGRYHSLIVEKESIPNCLFVTASTEDGIIMGLKHSIYPVFGIQFHPESILTPNGKKIMQNFLNIVV